jgi:hypothetical protein
MSTATAPRDRTIATVRINTSARMVLYRDFIIQEGYDTATRKDVWEWTHQEYGHDATPQYLQVTGTCQTLYGCIDAVNEWYDTHQANEAARDEIHEMHVATFGGQSNV